MIVCKECGFQSADSDSFCGACGGFLEWTGERQAPVAVVDEAEGPKRKVGIYERIQKVIYADIGEAKPVESSSSSSGSSGPVRAGWGPIRSRWIERAARVEWAFTSGCRSAGVGPVRAEWSARVKRSAGVGSAWGGCAAASGVGSAGVWSAWGGCAAASGVGSAGSGPPRRPGSGPPGSGPPGVSPPPRPPVPPRPGTPPSSAGTAPPPTSAAPTTGPAASTAGPASAEAREVAAALVARPPAPIDPTAGPALPPRTQPPPVAPAAGPTSSQTSAPEASQPAAIQPQAAQRRKPPKVQPGKPTRTPQKGDLICGECGEANVPGRKFCSRCGASLATAAIVRIPWWKRLLPRRRPKSAMAGERPWASKQGRTKRPKRRGFARIIAPVRRVGGILLLVAGIVYGVYSPFREWVNDRWHTAKDKADSIIHPSFDPVTPGPGTTSNEAVPLDPEHPASMATDGFKNTYWLSPPPAADFRPELDVALTEQVDLARIIVHSGAADDFQGHHRPKTLLFIFDTGASEEVDLKNTPEPQTITIDSGRDVQRFKIAITSVFESIDGTDVALDEIEFFEKG